MSELSRQAFRRILVSQPICVAIRSIRQLLYCGIGREMGIRTEAKTEWEWQYHVARKVLDEDISAYG